jgi:serine/threonine-protein kinase
VVRVFETSNPDAPLPYIAMERLRGQDLSDYLRAHGRMRMTAVLRLIRQVGRGLDAARSKGIVHRDIKPRNVFCAEQPGARQPIWKILDFGVSKLIDAPTMTHQNIVGTPSYMAPEQASGGDVSHRADLFALAVIAYRALTGRPAFPGDAPAAILYQVVHRMPPRPSDFTPKLNSDIDGVLAIAMAKDPWERFDSAAEFADALENARKERLPAALRERAARLQRTHPWD